MFINCKGSNANATVLSCCFRSELSALSGAARTTPKPRAAAFIRPLVRSHKSLPGGEAFSTTWSDTGGAARAPHVKILAVVFALGAAVLSKRETGFNSPSGRRRIDRYSTSGRAIDQSQRAVLFGSYSCWREMMRQCGMPELCRPTDAQTDGNDYERHVTVLGDTRY